MIFAWDERKDCVNRRKHRVSFETAALVFEDPNAISYRDRVVNGEERWQLDWQAESQCCYWSTRAKKNMAKKKSASSRREKRLPASALFTNPPTDKQRGELKKLARMPDSKIDFSDAPERHVRAADIQIGRFYRPIKQLVSLRVDADVLAWFRGRGKRYQTYMNEVLRREMQAHPRGRSRPLNTRYTQ